MNPDNPLLPFDDQALDEAFSVFEGKDDQDGTRELDLEIIVDQQLSDDDCVLSLEDVEEVLSQIEGLESPASASRLRREIERKDSTIAELHSMLVALSSLGEEVGQSEKARALAELQVHAREGELARLRGQRLKEIARLRSKVRKLQLSNLKREGVLSRERKRHARTREKLKAREKQAIERWHKIQALRAQLKAARDAS